MTPERTQLVVASMLALVFALASALVVLIAYLIAELYLANKGWLVAMPDGRELAHVRMRDLLLLIGVPTLAVIGFAIGWFSHARTVRATRADGSPHEPR
ncbi:MAG: hypothetical protein H7125_05170 [Proteobacteria bacterium]|nr:hypothetical protein [Burkholderiales bacterium]